MNQVKKYLEKMKIIQENLLDYLDNEEDSDENFEKFQKIYNDQNIYDNKHELKLILYLLSNLSNNHHRTPHFYDKIDRILKDFQGNIKKFYINSEIFNIFKNNKRNLLFLIKEQIITIDEYIFNTFTSTEYLSNNYHQYFAPEIKQFLEKNPHNENKLTKDNINDINADLPDYFEENRLNGENHNYICETIQKDSIDDFIVYINKHECLLDSKIPQSIYETNSFLLKMKDTSLIEYAIFYGSIQILKYLQLNNVKLLPSFFYYAIYGRNAEIIHILEEMSFYNAYQIYPKCCKLAIKCHHNDIASYYVETNDNFLNSILHFNKPFKYYNFAFIEYNFVKGDNFYVFCKYDYYIIAKYMLNSNKFNINEIRKIEI